ncbi:MAG TPA: GNAT family N-acetyltransferase [Verrucomicrobiae bacterium]|jgi:ribosomal-protein-alanine N-acetyltransferase|nr:GNAT family N-acetyltransferase [Verrucomicrobiae bacterium]
MGEGVMVEGLVLETERLQLRRYTLADLDALAPIVSDPVAMEFYPAPLVRQGAEDWIQRNLKRYQQDGFGKWAMVLKDSGEFIGDCGCMVQDVEGEKEIEVGYLVRRDLWGKGYATEAARACMDYAFGRLGVDRVISMIRPENQRSRKVAEKNGMSCERIVFWRGYDHCVYAMKRNGA